MLTQRSHQSLLVVCFSFLMPLFILVSSHARADSPSYGKKLVAQYSVPTQQVERFQAFATPGANPIEPSQDSDTEAELARWMGPSLQVSRESGPYTVVLTVTGKARFDGKVSTSWQAGWAVDGGIRTSVFPQLSKNSVKAEQELAMIKAGAPTRFKEQQTVALVLVLDKAENFDFQKVDIEIWSGVAEHSLGNGSMSMRWFALGLIVLLLGYFWVRRR